MPLMPAMETRVQQTPAYFIFLICNWFTKFRSYNFLIKNIPRSRRSVDEADEDKIKRLIDANRRITIGKIAGQVNLPNSTVHNNIFIHLQFDRQKLNDFPINLIYMLLAKN